MWELKCVWGGGDSKGLSAAGRDDGGEGGGRRVASSKLVFRIGDDSQTASN